MLVENNFPYISTYVKIKVGKAETDPITVKSGLGQADSTSPFLFNLVLEKVIMETKIEPSEDMSLHESSVAYADDLVLIQPVGRGSE